MAIRYLSGINVDNNVLFVDDANNRVGIGTGSPSYTLHVNLNATGYIARIQGSTNNISFYDGGSGGIGIGTDVNQDLKLYTNDALNNGIVIKPSGNVGIGTTAPAQKLEVSGNIQLTNKANSILFGSSGGDGAWGAPKITRIGTQIIISDFSGVQLGGYDGSSYGPRLTVTGAGNVGIGTTSPASKLDVQLSSYDGITLSRTVQGGGTYIQGRSYDTSNVFRTSGRIVFGATAAASAADGFITFNTYSANTENERMRITSTGNVGIGTTSPAQKLDISQGSIFLSGSGSKYLYIRRYDGLGTHSFGVGSDEKLILSLSGSNPFIIDGGNVGIGTTSPLAILDVYQAGQPQLRVRGTAGANHLYQDSTTGTTINDGLFVGIGGDQTGYVYHYEAKPLVFATSNAERMRITAGGNVGIGTTSPIAKLHISSSGTPLAAAIQGDSKLVVSGVDGNMDLLSLDDNSTVSNSIGFGRFNSSTGALIHKFGITTWANSGSTGSNTGDRIAFNYGTLADAWSNSELMTIKASGNVGIGTTAPNYKLEVSGTGFFAGVLRASVANTFPIRAIATSGGVSRISFEDNVNQANDAVWVGSEGYNLCFGSSFSERMRVDSSGNVGIGTTAPQQLIHVLGATNGYAMIQGASDSGQAGIYFKKEDTTGTMNRTKGLIVFHTNVGSGWGRGHLGFCLNSAESNTVVSVSDEKFRMVDNGDFLADGDVVAYSTTISDARYKTNIQPIESALDKVNQMRGVSFDWTAVRSGREFGVIAQEIEQIAPEVVSEKELLNGDTMKTVSYTSLVPFLIESIKELTQQVNELKAQLDGLTK